MDPHKQMDGTKAEPEPFKSAQPAPGLNDNVDFMGKRLHIQTESIGSQKPFIVTQVFTNGRVIFSKKTEYPSALYDSYSELQNMMRMQHVQVMQKITDKEAKILGS
jgi:hypothetical protein